MIKKSKNNENKLDFDVMFNEVQEEIQEKDAEQDIVDRVPQLKQLSIDIDKATPSSMPSYPWNLQSAKPSVKKECSVLP